LEVILLSIVITYDTLHELNLSVRMIGSETM